MSQVERHEPAINDSDPRILLYIDAAKYGDYDTIREMIDEAVQQEDWAILRRYATLNSVSTSQLKQVNECLRIAQQEARGWRNVAKGLKGGNSRTAKQKVSIGSEQLTKAEIAKAKIGDNYLEIPWK